MKAAFHILCGTIVGLGLVLTAQAQRRQKALSDTPRIKAPDVKFEITDVEVVPQQYDDEAPDLNVRPEGEEYDRWVLIQVNYKWALTENKRNHRDEYVPQGRDMNYWLDELAFEWKVVLAQPVEGARVKADRGGTFNVDPKYAVKMQRTVSYTNVTNEDEHTALIFVDARTLARYSQRLDPSMFFYEVTVKINNRKVGKLTGHEEEFAFVAENQARSEHTTAEKKSERLLPRASTREPHLFISDRVKALDHGLLPRNKTPWEFSSYDKLETILPERRD